MITAPAEDSTPDCYEVVFGPHERDRQTYINYKDGSYVSESAEAEAARIFLGAVGGGTPCGLWVNGVLKAGVDTTGETETVG